MENMLDLSVFSGIFLKGFNYSMKKIALSLLAVFGILSLALAGGDGWLTNHEEALKKAKAEKKIVLMDFTGSDWCGWCIKLDSEVFEKKEFKDYANKNLVLLKLDFPMKKQLPEAEKAQNDKLQKEYKVQGFPTVVVLDSEGKQIGTLGYVEGGPTAFIAELEKVTKKKS
jgi:thioredoxin-related protein